MSSCAAKAYRACDNDAQIAAYNACRDACYDAYCWRGPLSCCSECRDGPVECFAKCQTPGQVCQANVDTIHDKSACYKPPPRSRLCPGLSSLREFCSTAAIVGEVVNIVCPKSPSSFVKSLAVPIAKMQAGMSDGPRVIMDAVLGEHRH